jgi:hypothetical protein
VDENIPERDDLAAYQALSPMLARLARAELEQEYQERTASAVKPASRPNIYSERRT